jgi:hypothetical protein
MPGKCFGQQTVPTTKTYIKLGEDFLHALYPELNDKKYTITVETSFRYDDPTDIPASVYSGRWGWAEIPCNFLLFRWLRWRQHGLQNPRPA